MTAAAPSRPLLTIGMPVYNGESSLPDALDSLLAQDFTDFVIHICDNGSHDRTAEICRDYAARDGRVQYHRNATNLGPVENFNRAFEYCQSPYFMVAPDDDTRERDFLSKCITALEHDPQAVLAYTYFDTIEPDGSRGPSIDDRMETVGLGQRARLRHVLEYVGWCSAIYGVMRAEALARTRRFKDIYVFDSTMLAELSLLGTFIKIHETLYHRKMVAGPSRSPRQIWRGFHPTNARRVLFLPRYWKLREIVCLIVTLDMNPPRKALLIGDTVFFLWIYPPIRLIRRRLARPIAPRTRPSQ